MFPVVGNMLNDLLEKAYIRMSGGITGRFCMFGKEDRSLQPNEDVITEICGPSVNIFD